AARPSASATAVGAERDPPPEATANATVVPAPGLPFTSATRTRSESTADPATMPDASAPIFVRASEPRTVVVAKDAAIDAPWIVAVAVLLPTCVPVTHREAATPSASVNDDAGLTVPPPAVTAKSTATPGTRLPNASLARTRSESPAPATVPAAN